MTTPASYRVPVQRPTPLAIRDRAGREWTVPGRVYRGLALHQPYEFCFDGPVPIHQPANDPAWAIVHVASGMRVGTVRGRVTAAWEAMCRVADAADWTRPSDEVVRDKRFHRLAKAIAWNDPPRAEEVLR